jgi:hypothetical protein
MLVIKFFNEGQLAGYVIKQKEELLVIKLLERLIQIKTQDPNIVDKNLHLYLIFPQLLISNLFNCACFFFHLCKIKCFTKIGF